MLIEFRHPVVSALLECNPDSLIGDLAKDYTYFVSCFRRCSEQEEEEDNNTHADRTELTRLFANLQVCLNFSHIKTLMLKCFDPPSFDDDTITLFWMKTPLLQTRTLKDCNPNERTKLIVTVGRIGDGVPDMSACRPVSVLSSTQKKRTTAAVNWECAAQKARVRLQESNRLSPDAREALKSCLARVHSSEGLQQRLCQVCDSNDPLRLVKLALEKDDEFRDFAHTVLSIIQAHHHTV